MQSIFNKNAIELSSDIVSLMSLKDGSEMHVEMVSRKEVLLRKEVQSTLTGGLDKLKNLKGVIINPNI